MTEQPAEEATKKCPYCAETIKADAIICRYCGRDIKFPTQPAKNKTVAEALAPKKSSNTLFFVALLGVGALCCLALLMLPGLTILLNGTATPRATVRPSESAWYACTGFIQSQLGLSFLDAQDYNPGGVVSLGNGQYQVDIYYAKSGGFYRCLVSRHSNGDWELLRLSGR